jgi:hypothetical protein
MAQEHRKSLDPAGVNKRLKDLNNATILYLGEDKKQNERF